MREVWGLVHVAGGSGMEPSPQRRRRDEWLVQLAQSSHAVALDAGQWPDLLHAVADYTGAAAAALVALDRRSGEPLYSEQCGLPEAAWSEYVARWVPMDPTLQALRSDPDRIFLQTSGATRPEPGTPFTRWLGDHADWTPFFAMRLHENRRRTLFLILLGGQPATTAKRGPREDVRAAASLVRSAAVVGEQLNAERSIALALASSLNYLPTAVLIVAEDGQVLYSNAAAEHLIRGSRILHLHDGRLRLAREGDNQTLHAQIRGVIEAKREERRRRLLQLQSADGQETFTALTAPLPSGQRNSPPRHAAAMVMIWEPELSRICIASLREVFGLTQREAELASHIANGRTIAAAATFMGISRSTARVHLERVLAKTGTHRQTELVALIRTSPAAQPPRLERRGD